MPGYGRQARRGKRDCSVACEIARVFGGLVGWWIGGLESESGRRLTGWPLQSGLPINVAEISGLSSTVPPACVRTVGAGCFCVCFLPCNLEKSATVTSLIA